jgi:glycosyltransferase involved in cell wall biosynthesis
MKKKKLSKKYNLSICIPTYNRPKHLNNCLEAIYISKKNCANFNFEICISDNGSEHNIRSIVNKYKNKLNIKFNRFKRNMGITVNFLKAVRMASGEFVWTIGNDDLILPKSLQTIERLLNKYKDVDYFFINAFLLEKSFLDNFTHPFSTYQIPKNLRTFSSQTINKKVNFWDIIDPSVSFDFLLGMFLSMFRRKMWEQNLSCLNQKNIKDKNWMSNTDNTFFNTMIFANAFKNSKAFIHGQPLCVCLQGVREWIKLYVFVVAVRVPEILDYYRSRGLPIWKYFYCKNFALRNFSSEMFKIFFSDDHRVKKYFNFRKHFVCNLIYPSVYFSPIYFIYKKLFNIYNKIKLKWNIN